MRKKGQEVTTNGKENSKETPPRSAAILGRGISTSRDYLEASVAVADDLVNGRFSASVGNAIGRNLGNALRMAELGFKYGTEGAAGDKVLRLGGK